MCRRRPRRVASALTARLPLWLTSATAPGRLRAQRVAPQRDALVQAHHPVAVGPDHRQAVAHRRGDEPVLERGRAALGEARAEHDRAAAAGRAGLVDHGGHAGGGDRHDDRVGRVRQVGERGEHRPPAHLAMGRVDAPDLALVAEDLEVAQRLVRVRVRPRRGADDRDRPRAHEAGEVHQCRSRSTPRRSIERATISRWISLVPSQMRSTRSSRRKRSATFVRM